MISYISSFKTLWIALLVILSIEAGSYFLAPDTPYKSNLFQFAYHKEDVVQKYHIESKALTLTGVEAEFVLAGDSTGLYGVIPKTVMQYLGGRTMVNTNCCMDANYKGLLYIAEHFLRNNPKREYMLLHLTPYFFRKRRDETLQEMIYKRYISPFRIVNELPSLRLRPSVVNGVYYSHFDNRIYGNPAPHDQPGITESMQAFPKTLGWIPVAIKGRINKSDPPQKDACTFADQVTPEMHRYLLDDALESARNLAARYGVRLMIVFSPVSCRFDPETNLTYRYIREYAERHPEVIFPMGYINTMYYNDFFDYAHLTPEGAESYSHLLGQSLQKYLSEH